MVCPVLVGAILRLLSLRNSSNACPIVYSQGDELVVLQKLDDGWSEGALGGNIGHFPNGCVVSISGRPLRKAARFSELPD